jgi:hypothetical protein
MGKWLAIAALLGLLGLALWVAFEQWILVDVEMPAWGWAMMIVGVILCIAVGGGLMALIFYSSRMGYDEPPHAIERRDD